MRACARVALVLMALSASFGLAGCSSIDDLKDTISRWFDIGKFHSHVALSAVLLMYLGAVLL